jgi:hypothetical protein
MTRRARIFRVELVSTIVAEIHLCADDIPDARGMAASLWRDHPDDASNYGFKILRQAVQATKADEVHT